MSSDVERTLTRATAAVFATLCFKFTLDYILLTYLADEFGDHPLTPFHIDFDAQRYLLCTLWAGALGAIASVYRSGLRVALLMIPIIFLHVPLLAVSGLDVHVRLDAAVLSTLALSAYLLALGKERRPALVSTSTSVSPIPTRMCWALLATFFVWALVRADRVVISFDLSRIYELRDEAQESFEFGPAAYVTIWAEKVAAPFLLMYSLTMGAWLRAAAIICCFVIFFGITQHRSHLMMPVLVGGLFFAFRTGVNYSRALLVLSLVLALATCIALYGDWSNTLALAIRRPFFVPAAVTRAWVDFFGNQPLVGIEDRVPSSSFGAGIGRSLPLYLGEQYAPGTGTAFNCGAVGAGYARFGVLGVAFYGFAMGFVARSIERIASDRVPLVLALGVMAGPIRTAWADSDLPTSLVTHGILLGLGLLFLASVRRFDRGMTLR